MGLAELPFDHFFLNMQGHFVYNAKNLLFDSPASLSNPGVFWSVKAIGGLCYECVHVSPALPETCIKNHLFSSL